MPSRRQFLALGTALGVASSPAVAAEGEPPRLACDCHVHIIGPPGRYPMVASRSYTPPQSSVEGLQALHRRLGIARSVLVQPSFYGTDNRAMMDALATLGGAARGIAVVDPSISDAELARLDAAGVRGIRLNMESAFARDPRAVTEPLAALAARLAQFGWHVQLFAALPVISRIAPDLAALPVPVVLDHFGMPDAALGPDQPGFGAVLDLVRARHTYVKLSAPYRISRIAPDYPDVRAIAQALIAAGPDRMLWASDWPHTDHAPGASREAISPFRVVDDAAILTLLPTWCPDAATRRAILVDTPARLYRFG